MINSVSYNRQNSYQQIDRIEVSSSSSGNTNKQDKPATIQTGIMYVPSVNDDAANAHIAHEAWVSVSKKLGGDKTRRRIGLMVLHEKLKMDMARGMRPEDIKNDGFLNSQSKKGFSYIPVVDEIIKFTKNDKNISESDREEVLNFAKEFKQELMKRGAK